MRRAKRFLPDNWWFMVYTCQCILPTHVFKETHTSLINLVINSEKLALKKELRQFKKPLKNKILLASIVAISSQVICLLQIAVQFTNAEEGSYVLI